MTLTQLSATRNGTALSVEQAQREYSKLSIVAPFDGTITKVIGAVGQRTSIGTPMLEIVSNTPEILVDLDNDIATTLSISDTVSVKVE